MLGPTVTQGGRQIMSASLARPSRPARIPRRWVPVLAAGVFALGLVASHGTAHAETAFAFDDEPIHPGCIHALAMQDGDTAPVTTSISLRGCKSSIRSRAVPTRNHEGTLSIEDAGLLGPGSFGYRHLSTLQNGIFILGIVRTQPGSEPRMSLAAMELRERPLLVRGEIAEMLLLESIGEVWIDGIEIGSLRTVGNTVHFSAGVGPSRRQRSIDLSRIKRARD